jgi:RES domain
VTAAPRPAPLWRVGYHLDPLGFLPRERCSFNHRFDDAQRRFRTLYLAELPETALREVLADLRPNRAAQARHIAKYGPEAADDFASEPVTAAWRRQHVLAPASVALDGHLVDLTDVSTRYEIEGAHLQLLSHYGMAHLDLHEITSRRRPVTQTIAGELFDQGAAAIRFPSRLDSNPCLAVFEGRATLEPAGEPLNLIDPPPEPLVNACAAWHLPLEAATAMAEPEG